MGYASYFEDIRDKSNNGLECINRALSAMQVPDLPQLREARKLLKESKLLMEEVISIANGVDLILLRKLDNIEENYHEIRRRREKKYKQKKLALGNCLDKLALYDSLFDKLWERYPDICYELFPPSNDR